MVARSGDFLVWATHVFALTLPLCHEHQSGVFFFLILEFQDSLPVK